MAKLKKQHRPTPEQLAADSAHSAGLAFEQTAPPTPEDQARWAKGQGPTDPPPGPGRPKVGEGAVVTSASLEAGLLRRALEKAKALGLKRSEYITRALELLTDGKVRIGEVQYEAVIVRAGGGAADDTIDDPRPRSPQEPTRAGAARIP